MNTHVTVITFDSHLPVEVYCVLHEGLNGDTALKNALSAISEEYKLGLVLDINDDVDDMAYNVTEEMYEQHNIRLGIHYQSVTLRLDNGEEEL